MDKIQGRGRRIQLEVLLFTSRQKLLALRHDVNDKVSEAMKDWKRYERNLHYVGPHWIRFFGDGLVGTAFEEPNAEGRFAWFVADSQRPGAKTFRQGLAPSIGEAKLVPRIVNPRNMA